MITNNLEHLKFGQITDEEGNSYTNFRKTLRPLIWKVWVDIFILYLLQIIIFSIMAHYLVVFSLLNIILTLFFAILIGFFLASLNLFIHEASHFNIHKNKKKNDFLANIFIGLWFGMNVKTYRLGHWQHHEKLGTTEDTEHSYFYVLNWKFILSTLFGIHLVKIVLFRKKNITASVESKPEDKKMDKIMLIAGLICNLILLGIAYYMENYFWIPAWIIGMFSLYPFFNAVRQLMEHRDELASETIDYEKINHGKVSRFFNFNIFSYFFGGAGFDKHLLHHWDPQISYTRLGEVENFLLKNHECQEIIKHSKTNYFITFFKLLR